MIRQSSQGASRVRSTRLATRFTLALAALACLAFAIPPAAAGAGAGPVGGTGPVAKVSVIAPPMEYFIVEATLPVPPRTVLDGMAHVPLAIAYGVDTFTTQVEIVSRYSTPSEGADVVELIARVRRPVGIAPGEEIEFDVVRAHQTKHAHQTTPEITSLIQSGGVNLTARDLHDNQYRINLLDRVRHSHPSVTTPRDGTFLREYRSHEVMRPAPGSGQGATAPAPHMLGVHVFTRTYTNEDFLILDLLLHNGMFSSTPSTLDDPIDDIYFDELALDLPAGWSMAVSVENPSIGDPTLTGGRVRQALVKELRYGQYHFVPQLSQFVRRVVIARNPQALARGTSVLRRETRGFCVPGGGQLWSWWHPATARFLATNAPIPTLDHLSRAGMTDTIRARYESHAEQIRTGSSGSYPRTFPLLGWAHPWGGHYGGETGGSEIEMYPNVPHAWVRHPVALRELELKARAYVDRQPIAMFDLDGDPPIVDEHVVNSGSPAAYVPTEYYLQPTPNEDYWGLESTDRRFTELAYTTARIPYYKKDLEDFRPIDFAHLTRFMNPHLGLVWLANDSIAKLEFELLSAVFHFSYHEHFNSAWGYVQGTGLRKRIEDTIVNPAQGGSFGRAAGWSLIASCTYYAFANADERARLFPWLRQISQTARRSQSTCTGNPTAIHISKAFKGVYRSRQSFEVGFFVNACQALRTTVFEVADPPTADLLRDLIVEAAYSTISHPFWDPLAHGQIRLIAVRPFELAQQEFCHQIPSNGFDPSPYRDRKTAMPAWAFAYRETRDGLFLQRASEALGGSGNVLTELENRGLQEIDGSAPFFALVQSL